MNSPDNMMDEEFDKGESCPLHLEKLQIGSPAKNGNNAVMTPNSFQQLSLSFPSPLPSPGTPVLWKDYPFVSHGVPGPMSQNSFYSGSNAFPSPVSSPSPVPSFASGPNFNNYRSSSVADIFGGRSKSKTSLICPSKLKSRPIFSMPAGYYCQSTSPDVWNLMENPISRSSSQSSGFVSQKELELEYEQQQRPGRPPPGFRTTPSPLSTGATATANFQTLNYTDSESICSQRQFSIAAHWSQQQRPYYKEILTQPPLPQLQLQQNANYRNSYPPPTSTPICWSRFDERNSAGSATIISSNVSTSSRFGPGPRSSSFLPTTSTQDSIFSDAEDDSGSGCDSFKTAQVAASIHSLHLRRRKTRKIEEVRSEINLKNGCEEIRNENEVRVVKKSKFIGKLFQLFSPLVLFMAVVVMFWLVFGSHASRVNFFETKCVPIYQSSVQMSLNFTAMIRDSVKDLVEYLNQNLTPTFD